MKFCMDHWNALKAAVEARGLGHLIARSGDAVAGRVSTEATQGPSKETFEPLLGAHNAILSNALRIAGLAVMMPNEDGSERCPLCFLITNCGCPEKGTPQCAFAKWIDHAADDMVTAAKELGAIPAA